MRGSVFKRCTCPDRVDARGRKVTCGKQHGSWSYKVDLPSLDGGRRQLVRGGYPTREDAEEALAEVLAKAHRGVVLPSTRLTVGDYLDQWLQSVKPALEVAAWTNYRTCIERYVRPSVGRVELAKLTGAMLSAHYASLIEGGGRNGRALSPTTVRTVHRVINKALGDAVRDDLLLVNPAHKAVPPKRRRYEATVWTAEQAMPFLTAMREDPLYACWLVALSCGLRRGELAGLRWRDVDLERATLRVTTQRTTDADYNIITKGPKGTGRRTIDLGVGTVAALRSHRDAQQAQYAQAPGVLFQLDEPVADEGPKNAPKNPKNAPEYVFLSEDLQPIHPQRLTEPFQKAAKDAGVPVIRLHDARHSCATSPSSRACTPRSCSSSWGTPRGPRRWTSTRTGWTACSAKRLSASRTSCSPGRRQPMGRASRKRAEQRASVTAKVFRVERPPGRQITWAARDGFDLLQAMRQRQIELDLQVEAQVRELILMGASWADLGRALGISRQGARQRYG